MLSKIDVPKVLDSVADKGFELAEGLLDPDSFFAIADLQKQGVFEPLVFDEDSLKVSLKSSSGRVVEVAPEKVIESGVAVCSSKDGGVFFSKGGQKGVAMVINRELCRPSGEYVGSLHTHPGGSSVPSVGDLVASTSNRDGFMCIASRMGKDLLGVNCYVPHRELFPEEIMGVESRHRSAVERWAGTPLKMRIVDRKLKSYKSWLDSVEGSSTKKAMVEQGFRVDDLGLVSVPVVDRDSLAVFSSGLMDDVEDFYTVHKFRRGVE